MERHRKRRRPAPRVVAAAAVVAQQPPRPDVDIEYVVEKPVVSEEDMDPELARAIERLARVQREEAAVPPPLPPPPQQQQQQQQTAVTTTTTTTTAIADAPESRKQQKKKTRPTVALLKQVCARPAVVEVHDVTSPDPELLTFLKARRMAVPVPRHWSSSTKYLGGKRLSDKKPFQLPEYIANTGIAKLREASDDAKDSLQKRMRDRAKPKLGRIEIDYQVLHDAFFKFQTKPRLTRHGDLYHEGKELEKDFSKFVPGVLSDELKNALGMPLGETSHLFPPPWLYTMQRLGPPPSYSTYAFPGVNAPIPAGTYYGTHPGGWGKPPLDVNGRGLYGDVLGLAGKGDEAARRPSQDPIRLWGSFTVADEDEEDEKKTKKDRKDEGEEEEEEAEEENRAGTGEEEAITSYTAASKAAANLLDSLDSEMKSLVPEQVVDLRKKPVAPAAAAPASAHRVLEKQAVSVAQQGSGQVFGAAHKYATAADISVSIAPEDLREDGELDAKDLMRRYEDEKSRTRVAMGVAPGAGTLNVSEIEQEMMRKPPSTQAAASKPTKKDKFKF